MSGDFHAIVLKHRGEGVGGRIKNQTSNTRKVKILVPPLKSWRLTLLEQLWFL